MKPPTTTYRLQTQKGFTLIEAVVATGVFAFVITSVLGVYLAVMQLDAKSRANRVVHQNARFIMEFLGKEVRNGRIFYAAYPGGVVNSTLALQNQAEESEYFYLQGTDLQFEKAGAVTNLNSNQVKVTRLTFYIAPSQNPFDFSKTVNEQPRVTVVLSLQSNIDNKTTNQATIDLQSTFAIREYPSREP